MTRLTRCAIQWTTEVGMQQHTCRFTFQHTGICRCTCGSVSSDALGGTWEAMTESHCSQCHHPQSWHRHSDESCSPEHAPFRCIGYDCMKSGFPAGTPETRCGCPDFRRPA